MKNVTFITTGQPTTNPRMVKEAETLIGLGYNVKVICCFYQSWAQPFDEEITQKNPGVYIYCGGSPTKQKTAYFKNRLRQKLSQFLWRYIKTTPIAENAISRTHTEAVSIAKKLKTDIYIAHNLGALPAAVIAAKHQGVKVGYDAEDMHSGQFTSATDQMYLLNKFIEDKYFRLTNYFTVASPLIGDYYEKAYPFLKPIVINNVFPKIDIPFSPHNGKASLKLFWFSQTIGSDRGLELIIKAIGNANGKIQLHLLGDCSATNQKELADLASAEDLSATQLQFYKPIPPDEVFDFAAQFDIGMASETASTLNRDICLTNKIFTYLQCGLAIIASDTQAQRIFINQYPASGVVYDKNDAHSLTEQLNRFIANPDLLYETRLYNYNLGQTLLNWEQESKTFTKLIKTTIGE